MSNGEPARYTLLPFVRQGISALVGDDNPEIGLRVSDAVHGVPLELYGPGDISGFDPRVVVRTEPRPAAADFESNYLPAIEFDRPDFPWLFSPPADSGGRLLPWICLAVFRRDDHELKPPAGGALPPSVFCAASELPDPGETWAWAHTQVLRGTEPLEHTLRTRADLNVSRLLCPRRLEPGTHYVACVIPTFKAGVEAGLGQSVTSGARELAWGPAVPDLTLPVYFHWEFRTGPAGDFESLARRIKPRPLPPLVGRRELDVSAPGFGLPGAGVLNLEGVLRPVRPRRTDRNSLRAFQQSLQRLLNEPAVRQTRRPAAGSTPIVAPPIYGQWQAGRDAIDDRAPAWLRELNLDPRHRVAASFGALVVRQDQEALMASAWDQLGEIQRANQLLRQAQLGRSVSAVIHEKRLGTLPPDRLVQVSAPVLSRIRATADPRTVLRAVRDSAVPAGAVSPGFRRVTRPRGPIARRTPGAAPASMLQRLASNQLSSLPVRTRPRGILTSDVAANLAASGPGTSVGPRLRELTPDVIRSRPLRASRPAAGAISARVRDALAGQYDYVRRTTVPEAPPARLQLPLAALGAAVLDRLNPSLTIPSRVRDRLGPPGAPPPPGTGDPLEPIRARPEFPQPMYQPLRAIAQDLILPGLEHVPPDTVQVVEVNRPFLEAYMAGLNHEMNRELLWREFPTDQRGTYFTRFWDFSTDAARGDIGPLDGWDGPLGENVSGPAEPALLVLLLKGELLRRYPGAIIYAAKASRAGDRWMPGGEERQPLFRGSIDPDVVFVSFGLTLDEALGRSDADSAGWYFMIQEQPTEPRFGFEAGAPPTGAHSIERWKDLAWGHLTDSHAPEGGSLRVAGPLDAIEKQGVIWGHDSAHMATIALQYPFRVALHARILLQPE